MGGYIGSRSVVLSTTAANVQDVTATDTTPEVTIINNTHEDTDGGREGKIIFKGQQSGGEESTLAEIQGSHDGTADDEKGDLIFRTNDGSDGTSPTEVLRTNSAGNLLITSSDQNGLTLNTTDSNGGFIALKTSGTAKGYIGTSHHLVSGGSPSEDDITIRAEGKLQFAIGATEELRLDSDGLKFNGDTAAANALDDYEEGTWTPTLHRGDATAVTTTNPVGMYRKVGSLVFVQFSLTRNDATAHSGNLQIKGLPFSGETLTYLVRLPAGSAWIDNGAGSDRVGWPYIASSNQLLFLQDHRVDTSRYQQIANLTNSRPIYGSAAYITT